jgi:hypothetical protein
LAQPAPAALPEHQHLEQEVGVWDATVKFWPTPDAPAMESKARETGEMVGGLWLVSKFEGDFGGIPFTGHGQYGYDPQKKKYVGTWIDSMSPYMQTMEGEYNETENSLVMIGTGRDPQTGAEYKSKNVTRYKEDGTRVFEMFGPDSEGEMRKMMEIEFRRAE